MKLVQLDVDGKLWKQLTKVDQDQILLQYEKISEKKRYLLTTDPNFNLYRWKKLSDGTWMICNAWSIGLKSKSMVSV